MRREHIGGAVTVLVLVAILVVLGARNQGRTTGGEPEKPSAVVFDLFQRAKQGDVRGYLGCFSPRLRETVEASSRDMGEPAFRGQIKAMGEAVKGVLVQEDRVDAGEARLRVELVYGDRAYNDVQTFTLERRGKRWLIGAMSRAEPLKMPIPYGTPAYPLELDSQPSAGDQAPPATGDEQSSRPD